MNGLFIGLGGAGCSAVAEYAKLIQNAGVNTNDEFLYFDTEVAIKETYPIIGDDFVHLGSINPGARHTINKLVEEADIKMASPDEHDIVKDEAKQFLLWFDRSIRSGEPLDKGAEGVRMMSRAMLYADYDDIKRIIAAKRSYLVNGLNKDRRIYVVSGTCGGTGAGIVLDVLYMIQEIVFQRSGGNMNDPDVSLLLIMPQGYVFGITDPNNKLYIPYRTNPYALFDELNGCLKDYNGYYSDSDVSNRDENGNATQVRSVADNNAGKRFHFYRCCGNDVQAFPFTVCMNAYMFDSVDSNTGEPLSPAQRSANVGNFLFVMEAANEAQDNLNTTVSNQLRLCKYASRHKQFIEGFSATGLFIAQSWEELTKKYVHDKMLYQMVKYGFIGGDKSSSYDEVVISEDRSETVKEVNKLIEETDYQTSLDVVLEGLKEEDLKAVYTNIQGSTNKKRNAIRDIFTDSNNNDEVEGVAKMIDQLLSNVRKLVFGLTSEWMKTYNLQHALALVDSLDKYFDDQYLESARIIKNSEMKVSGLHKDTKRRECCSKLFGEYVKYLVFRNLSNANDGYLDKCRDNLKAAIDVISIENTDAAYGVKIGDLKSDFQTYLNRLKNDNKRKLYPSLDQLYNFETSSFVAGNEVERKYASLVAQNPDGSPILSRKALDENGEAINNLLYLYKDDCIRSLSENEVTWNDYFVMTEETIPAVYGQKVKIAYERFVKEALKKADKLSQDPSLNIPFPTLNQQEQAELIRIINNFNQISLSVKYTRTENAHTSIVVGDLENNTWLKTGLFPVRNGIAQYNTMEKISVQSTDMPDRFVLLYVHFGHALNDYAYYSTYREKYEYIVAHPKEKVNPTYIDKRFWDANGDIGAFFSSISESAEKARLIDDWKGYFDYLLKFVSLFLYKTLDYHFTSTDRDGLDLLDKMEIGEFLTLEEESDRGVKTIKFHKTVDYQYNREKEKYTPSGAELCIDFARSYRNLTDLRASVPYFEFWNEILIELGTALDSDAIVTQFNDAMGVIATIIGDNVRALNKLNNLRSKYLITDQQTNRQSVDWVNLISRFITISKK